MQPSNDPVEIQYTCKTGQRYCFWLELNNSEPFHPSIRRLYAVMTIIRNTIIKIDFKVCKSVYHHTIQIN
jgi:hypothetical protein